MESERKDDQQNRLVEIKARNEFLLSSPKRVWRARERSNFLLTRALALFRASKEATGMKRDSQYPKALAA